MGLETKISQVLGQLKSGKAVIVFDQDSETCNILKSNAPSFGQTQTLCQA
jgi:uncharacterized protein YheU (UPF0270 family)